MRFTVVFAWLALFACAGCSGSETAVIAIPSPTAAPSATQSGRL